MQLLFDQMIKKGFEIRPYKGKAIQVSPKELVVEYQKVNSLSLEDLLPKRQSTRNRWKKAYKIITEMREDYQEGFLEGKSHDPKPNILEIRQRILVELGWSRSDKTIYRIIKAGDKGCLD